jgi:AcrR family transcriptional regulator
VTTDEARRRRPRADARRNYERLLAEADCAFRELGTDAALETIARRAQVAIGTLYGHFPSRRALVGALLHDRNEALFELGDRLLADPAPLPALATWIRAAAEHAAGYRGLAAMLADGVGNEDSELHQSCLRMAGIGRDLAARASDAGAIRPGVTGADVTALISAVAWTSERTSPQQARRLLDLAIGGLRPAPDPDMQTERVVPE